MVLHIRMEFNAIGMSMHCHVIQRTKTAVQAYLGACENLLLLEARALLACNRAAVAGLYRGGGCVVLTRVLPPLARVHQANAHAQNMLKCSR